MALDIHHQQMSFQKVFANIPCHFKTRVSVSLLLGEQWESLFTRNKKEEKNVKITKRRCTSKLCVSRPRGKKKFLFPQRQAVSS